MYTALILFVCLIVSVQLSLTVAEVFSSMGKSSHISQPTKNSNICKPLLVIPDEKTLVNKAKLLNVRAGKSIGPITQNVAITVNALLGVMVFVETSLFQKYFFNIAFGIQYGAPIPDSASFGFRNFGLTTLLLHVFIFTLKDTIGLSKTLNLYAIAALSRAILIGAYYFKGVVISSIPVVISAMLAIVSSYLALE